MHVVARIFNIYICLLGYACLALVSAKSFGNENNVLGRISVANVSEGETLSDIARMYNVGYTEIRIANSKVDPWLPREGQEVMIPDMHVLPYATRNDIVINVPEMRMYYYGERAASGIRSFPISVGRQDWTTPHGEMVVTGKLEAPAWYPPASILEEHEEMGEPLPRIVPAGPDNPLGRYALLLSKKSYLIHGTNKPYGIGMRVTHGCVRMYPKHIEWLFTAIKAGATVKVVNQPLKVGRMDDVIFLEAHPSLNEDRTSISKRYSNAIGVIKRSFGDSTLKLSYHLIQEVLLKQTGVPIKIGNLAD
jgi:L,D-transpeptidase ErfK/SrfK